MVKLSSLLITVGLVIGFIFFMFDVVAPRLPSVKIFNKLDSITAKSTQGSSPQVHDAISQVRACISQKMGDRSRSEPWDQQRFIVWDPCVQEGVTRLDQSGHHNDVNDFRQRTAPLAVALAKYYGD